MAQGAGENISIRNATTQEEIRKSLAELSEREEHVTARLDELLASQRDLSRQLHRLDLARAQLGSQVVAVRGISHGMLSAAASTAQRISGAVKKLDQEQAAVKATLEVVEQVAELKSCVLGVTGSMGMPQDWETAASYLHRASQIPATVIDGAFAEQIVPTAEVPDTPRQTLDSAAESLCALFLREFETAAQAGNGAGVTRFFKLFPLIGRRDIGLDAYGRYVCGGISARARAQMSSTVVRKDGIFYANALTKLFEHIAQIVDAHQPLVERHYGAGSMVKVIERIQVEADLQGGLILDTWADERKVNRRLTEVKSYPFNFLVQSFLNTRPTTQPSRTGSPAPSSGRTSEDDGVDMKDIDALLNESATMLGRWSLYTRFLASKTSTETEDSKLHIPAFIVHSTLQKKVTELLIEPFNTLASFFFRRSVEKSFQLDEAPAELTLNPLKPLGSNPPYITSAVDDVMYIVKQILQRTLATCQKPVVSSVVPSIGQVLGSDFFGMIQRKMRDESYPRAVIQGALPPENLVVAFLVLLNNLDVSVDYVHRIIGETASNADDHMAEQFPFGNESVVVLKAMSNMESRFELKITELVTEAVNALLKQVLGPRTRPVLADAFRDVDYLDSADDGLDEDDNDADVYVAQRFERGWQAFMLPVKRITTDRVYDKLLSATVLHLAKLLEKRIRSYYGRVNELGAVRLERDVTGIMNAAVRGGRYELRELFSRCMQMTLIMNMEDDEWNEISKLTGVQLERETGIDWKIDIDDRKFARNIVKDRQSS